MTEIETRDAVAALLREQGGVGSYPASVELADAILRLVNGRPATAAGGPPSTLPVVTETAKPSEPKPEK